MIVNLTRQLIPQVAEIETICFSSPWSPKSLEMLTDGIGIAKVMIEDGIAVGYGGMLSVCEEGQITNIAVLPEYRRRGYGEMITQALTDHARDTGLESVTLEVRESNAPARALYEKLGFSEVGYRPKFYSAPVEAGIIMRKYVNTRT